MFGSRNDTLKGVQDRASKRLFTKEVLIPGADRFPEPSQKIVSATGSRYFIFWVSKMMNDILNQWGDDATEYMMCLSRNKLFQFFVV